MSFAALVGDRLARAEKCPHPDRLERAAVIVNGGGGDLAVCHPCKAMFEGLIASWRARTIGPAGVVDTMRRNGYSRGDAARFVLQLVADRLRVRLGFAVPE